MVRQSRPPILVIVVVLYFGFLLRSLHHDTLPQPPCAVERSNECYHPIILPGETLELSLWLWQPEEQRSFDWTWQPVETCRLNVSVPLAGVLPNEVKSGNCSVTLPEFSRIRWSSRTEEKNVGAALQAKFIIRQIPSGRWGQRIVAELPFALTRIVKQSTGIWDMTTSSKQSRPRKLLDSWDNKAVADDEGDFADFVPYLKYGSQPLLIRFVAEYRPYGGPPPLYRGDGTILSIPFWNQSAFLPTVYVDDTGLLQSSQRELARNGTGRPPVHLRIKLSALSPIWNTLNLQVMNAVQMAESVIAGPELDELRYFLRDERLNRLFWTQVISWTHLWLDYMAFRDEVRFYRGRKDLSGVSVSSVVTQLLCSWIIFLYLLDGGGTSWVVLVSLLSSVLVDGWKVWKLLRPEIGTTFPFLKLRQIQTSREQETDQYDRIAVKYLCFVLYPLVASWSLYALYHYTYQSWYSWFISNLANAVYTFGFISLCPQLYINYRLKSVAHLPWKVFLYKIFNTFVDDFFAWIIEMPWKHRIMTLRDDVVFAIFLLQAYWYRVDLTRTNEFGYAYDKSGETSEEKDALPPTGSSDASRPKEKMN